MRATTLLGVVTGVITGIVGIVLVMMLTAHFCSSMSLMFDDLSEPKGFTLDGRPPGLECGSWSDLVDRLLLELIPFSLVFAVSGALGTRIAGSNSPRIGTITGAIIAILVFFTVPVFTPYGPSYPLNTIRTALSRVLMIFLGASTGWAGGLLATRKIRND